MDNKESLQRKLIPVNIAICVLSLVAAFTLIFAPLITIDLGKAANEVTAIMGFETDESEGENSNNTEDAMAKMIVNLAGNFKIRLSTYSIGKVAFSDKPMRIVASAVADEVAKVQDDVVGTILSEVLPQIVAETNLGIDATKVDAKELMDKLGGVFDADSEESQQAAIDALIDSMQGQLVSNEGQPLITDDMKEELSDMINEMMNQVRESMGDDVTLESFICVTISKFMFGEDGDGNGSTNESLNSSASGSADNSSSTGGNGNSEKIYTNYNDLFAAILGADGEDGDGVMDGFAETLEPIINILKYFVYVMIFFAALWFIQAGFAALHIFINNKKCRMWYTKAFGFIPCLIFGVLPLVGKAVLASIVPEFAGLLNAYSSTTWISGACVIALWVITIVWSGPINRKIRRAPAQGTGPSTPVTPSTPSTPSEPSEPSEPVEVVESVEPVETSETSNSDE